MSKQILIISTSPRKGGNSDALAEAFARGAREAGQQVEKICLYDKTIGFCKGCLVCQKTQRCVIRDDADVIAQKMRVADTIVFATPVYYYGMCGQMKTLLDRANPLYSADYAFRDIYLLAAAAEAEESAVEGTVHGLEGWISCFEKARLAGVAFGGGADAVGSIQGNPALQKAYEIGKAVVQEGV
ncbi:flavodoxin family protein [Anaeromassilibacillus senegalensis]|uniref:flavodoxin family protein n=1 Tax=Anaeromassilibacillus senegalensis TaxID=1673717 RepID=UPI000682FD81|nr:flavodoxin family protein [Anaeromassilibacillus senegalensis]